jgi:hypothetical protein
MKPLDCLYRHLRLPLMKAPSLSSIVWHVQQRPCERFDVGQW